MANSNLGTAISTATRTKYYEMMKPLAFLLLFGAAATAGAADVRELLSEATEDNRKAKQLSLHNAGDSEFPELSKAYGVGYADAYGELLEYAKTSDDLQLKLLVLRLHCYDRLQYHLVDVEYGGDEATKSKAKSRMKHYDANLRAVLKHEAESEPSQNSPDNE
ncbi:hypothetical protein [Botrimarina mediterranea]|uniref:Uncharacterized protein n=1 Tax=Botrimarina mediterranea TaxID=2528022 RepID=A0A518K8R1_9BACT|nr:hypothetical protein [Botrimarina mediterranea]QDV74180.1 hypothetical protein Spa11_23800 [Botrimarina mediterranea]QDV78811.1 hypothetical protein K2D_24190 [Planctomycetes bacterium K2D]